MGWSIEYDPEALDLKKLERLEAQRRQTRQSRSQLVRTFVEEGLRMVAHPGIVFRSGPAGRRPALAAGPDVWEVVRITREGEARGEAALRRIADLTDLTAAQVEIALRYYADYSDEIDAWIRRVDEEAERAEAVGRRAQNLLGR